MKVAYKLKKLSLAIEAEERTYLEFRNGLLTELGNKDEAGELIHLDDGTIDMTDENRVLFYEKNAELLEAEFNLEKIPFEEFGDQLQITAQELVLLRDIID